VVDEKEMGVKAIVVCKHPGHYESEHPTDDHGEFQIGIVVPEGKQLEFRLRIRGTSRGNKAVVVSGRKAKKTCLPEPTSGADLSNPLRAFFSGMRGK
jgi:hypothetical protein